MRARNRNLLHLTILDNADGGGVDGLQPQALRNVLADAKGAWPILAERQQGDAIRAAGNQADDADVGPGGLAAEPGQHVLRARRGGRCRQQQGRRRRCGGREHQGRAAAHAGGQGQAGQGLEQQRALGRPTEKRA